MKKTLLIFSFFLFLQVIIQNVFCQSKEVNLKIIHTTDIHGNYFPYNFINEKPGQGSLSRVYSYVKQEREKHQVLLLDNGDILQGQPSAYYYNFIDTNSVHLCARIMNYMGYNAASMGNHDIETGPKVYDRFVSQCGFPWLAANAMESTGEQSYFEPYYIYEIEGVKIAVLGMITPAIPAWLPKGLWPDMYFNDITSTAQKWIPYLNEKEQPDIIVGLLHLGTDSRVTSIGIDEGGGENLAYSVPGFDIVMLGHDHRPICKKIANSVGDSVLIINPGANGNLLSEVSVSIHKGGKKQCDGKLINLSKTDPDQEFLDNFQGDYEKVLSFVSEKLAYFTKTISSRDAYFGPSAFVDLIHQIQFSLTDADVSFAAPLSFDTQIKEGDIFVSDMFKLYKYENFLYTMSLTGQEIKGFLEHSYGIWINQMNSPEDNLLLVKTGSKSEKISFVNPSYNFDSAAGISYSVDVTKPIGQRITIQPQMANGSNFDLNKKYRVAINSYRGNGGGGHLVDGSGIPHGGLSDRIITSTPVDLRYYIMEWMKQQKIIEPNIISNWKLVPESWTKPAAERDYKRLF